MASSVAVTRGVRVEANVEFVPQRSDRALGRWFFAYHIRITNEGAVTVQLLTRHWIITDSDGHVEEVQGPGVVGAQPVLQAGHSFEYTSFCPLRTPFGSMRGTYQMVTESGERFDAQIAAFSLNEPYSIH